MGLVLVTDGGTEMRSIVAGSAQQAGFSEAEGTESLDTEYWLPGEAWSGTGRFSRDLPTGEGYPVLINFFADGVDAEENTQWPVKAIGSCGRYVRDLIERLFREKKISSKGSRTLSLMESVYQVKVLTDSPEEGRQLCQALWALGWQVGIQIIDGGSLPGCSRVACRQGEFDIPTPTPSMKMSRMSGTGGSLEDGR